MQRLTGTKKVFAVASAVLLVAAASGSALAMIDQGLGSARNQPVQRQVRPTTSGQAQQSPLPTPTHTPESNEEVSFHGTVEIIATTGWVISGRTVQVTSATLVEIGVDVGSQVKVKAQRQADGSLLAGSIELIQNGGDENGNGNENDNGNDNENENDNHNGNGNVNSNDNNGNENDNHNGNSNENENENHNGNGNVNSNDRGGDQGNNNSNDNHGSHDHHSGNGNDQHGGGNHGGHGNH
jgi:hypothetical protein